MREQTDKIIQVEQLTKSYQIREKSNSGGLKGLIQRKFKQIDAVKDVSFSVQAGEILGYLGPNGAGKSTTIKMLTGLLVPTSGEVRCNGFIPWKERTRYVKEIGAVFGQRTSLWWDLPVNDSLEMTKYLYGISDGQYQAYLKRFNQTLALEEIRYKTVRSLSLGQRMRADLCATLLHNPKLLFLDEPTIGLDVVAKERIRDFILQINQELETTVILTTHDISDVEKLCQRVIIIDEGEKLFDGELTRLKERYGGNHRLLIHFSEEVQELNGTSAKIVSVSGKTVEFEFNPKQITSAELIKDLVTRYPVKEIEVRPPELEGTIRRIYENGLLSHTS